MHKDNKKLREINTSCFVECSLCQRIYPVSIVQDDGRYYININDALDYHQDQQGFICHDCQIKKSGAMVMREETIQRRQTILDLLQAHRSGVSIPDITAATGFNRQTVREDLIDLESIKLIYKAGTRGKARVYKAAKDYDDNIADDF